MPRSGYKHYKNYGQPGEFVFVTTTCLDFVHAFANPAVADLMSASLLFDCRKYCARLHAFVVMPHHMHAVIQLPNDLDGSQLMDRIKTNAARRILPRLDPIELAEFSEQTGLNSRSFWKVGYRSLVLNSNAVVLQKVRYIHANPVRAGQVADGAKYRWSSANIRVLGKLAEDWSLAIDDAMIEVYAPIESLKIDRRRKSAEKPSTQATSSEG